MRKVKREKEEEGEVNESRKDKMGEEEVEEGRGRGVKWEKGRDVG